MTSCPDESRGVCGAGSGISRFHCEIEAFVCVLGSQRDQSRLTQLQVFYHFNLIGYSVGAKCSDLTGQMFLYTCFGSEQTDREQTEMINTRPVTV